MSTKMYSTFFSIAIPYKNVSILHRHTEIVDSLVVEQNKWAICKLWLIIWLQIYLAFHMFYLYFNNSISHQDRIAHVDLFYFVFNRKDLTFIGFSAAILWLMGGYFYYSHYLNVDPEYNRLWQKFLIEDACSDIYIDEMYKNVKVDVYLKKITLRIIQLCNIGSIMIGK